MIHLKLDKFYDIGVMILMNRKKLKNVVKVQNQDKILYAPEKTIYLMLLYFFNYCKNELLPA